MGVAWMVKKINWGILGCGKIAGNFAGDLVYSKYGRLAAAASRSKQKAAAFAKHHGAVAAYGSYERLVQDAGIDAVYIATPHPMHADNALLAIEAGKHVLCEKPITINARQLERLILAARKKGVFLMEGMWTRFFPAMVRLRQWLREGRIGQVLGVEADFGVKFNAGPDHRIHNPHLGGGALLDLGIYPISFASMVYGVQPEKIVSMVHFCPTDVDDHAVLAFQYSQGATAGIGISSRVIFKQEARIYGTEGRITVHENFYRPNRLTLQMADKNPKTITLGHPGNGLFFEADHVAQCLRKGLFESDILPLAESLAIMKTMDRIRRQWKMRYPGE